MVEIFCIQRRTNVNKRIYRVVLAVLALQLLIGCVSQPQYSDYMGMTQEDALAALNRKKTNNTIKIAANWLLAGYGTFWIASVLDTIRLLTFSGDFVKVEGQIKATSAPGTMVGSSSMATAGSVQRTEFTGTQEINAAALDGAIGNAAKSLQDKLPKNMVVAVLSVTASNRNTSEYVIGELEYQFVNAGGYRIVDRRRIEQIRDEQNFQISGDVSDDSAVSLGNMLGANIVITGEISGVGAQQRLILKALNVQTAEIISIARESL
jgi:hypothetical protein